MFQHQTAIQLHQTDAAGVLFFGEQLNLVHDAYQALMASFGLPLSDIILENAFALPIVHTEADYLEPLHADDHITINVAIDDVGASSFTLAYTLHNEDDDIVGTAKTVHVAIDTKTMDKITLPDELKMALTSVE